MRESEGLVRRHDKYQFEVKLGYDLKPRHRKDRYRVETFFFLPENLDVNETTYSKAQFYRDLLLYIRFRTPDFSLHALTDPAEDRSPLARLPVKLDAYVASPSDQNARALDYELRLLGCVFKNALRFEARAVERALGPARNPTDARGLIDAYAADIRAVTARFRALRRLFHAPGVSGGLAATYGFTDEYISLLIEGSTHELFHRSPPLPPALADGARRLTALIEEETAHRRSAGYPSLIEENHDNETFVFRQSVLKKFIASSLHLVLRTEEEGKGLEQMALAIGAGVAMVFATAVAFFYQQTFGTLSLGFFGVLVVSYMFKDRLKAAIQGRLQRRLARHLFDQATDIYDPFNGKKIGVCREAVGFVRESKVDPRVLHLRSRDHITEIENTWRSEKVLHYLKDITLLSRRFWGNHSRKSGLTDIVRFNLRNFLLKMDEPVMDLFVLKNGRSETVRGTRVYHVNIVIKFVSEESTRYERLRLVLNREGIKRIEPVASDLVVGEDPED